MKKEKGVPKAYFLAAIWFSTCPLLVSAAVANSCVIQKNVHGWILTSYLISMFLVNINSVVLILDVVSNSEGCGILDFTMKFIYMSTLCWMTSMNFGLWRTFSSTVPQVVAPKRFILSAAFSLGFPAIAVSISYYVAPYRIVKSIAAIANRNLPLVKKKLVHSAFIKTSITIGKLRKQAEAILHKQTKDHLESFTLFAKLFLLTGSIWIIRVILLLLQIQGLYVTWYGVCLEAVFSIPEVVFPMIIFHHREFIKWAWHKSPMISRILIKCNPFCRKDIFKEVNSLELQSGNQMSFHRHIVSQTNTHMANATLTAT
ncbi:G-protein coupled receptor Mth2 [Orchesella cincta]|uniref:G-protein coupled receptor Mth2 n=1 Tax=Orchesella cincta TaxID=48709 RepID=A0A1D2N1K2_ORCCI|nr:G-protein coupled receptor Mth2 [Orchesella cincta]